MENQKKYKNVDHYNDDVNKWLRHYLEIRHKRLKIGKCDSDKQFSDISGIPLSRIRRICGGNAEVNIDDLKKISKAANVTLDQIIYEKEIPDSYKNVNAELLTKEAYNVLLMHSTGKLFNMNDDFIIFLNYLIQQEKFILFLSKTSNELLAKFKKSSNLQILTDFSGYDDFKKKITNTELQKELNDLIRDSSLREHVRELVAQYISEKLR